MIEEIPKKERRITASKTKEGLTFTQEAFCQSFLDPNVELYGNGTKAYLATYGKEYFQRKHKQMSYKVAMSAASDLLRNPKIIDRITSLLESGGLNNENVDKQLLHVINQNSDYGAKVASIREFNKLKARIQDKLDITSGGKPIPIISIKRDDE